MNDLPELVAKLRSLQDGRCGICGGSRCQLVTDHDHDTGFVRGLLCHSCNSTEAHHGDCADWARCSFCRWRRQPSVCLIGWTCHYRPSGYGLVGPRAIDPVLDGQVPYVDMPGTMKRRFSRPQIDRWLADGCPRPVPSKDLAVAS